jgi:hypothetical protein
MSRLFRYLLMRERVIARRHEYSSRRTTNHRTLKISREFFAAAFTNLFPAA